MAPKIIIIATTLNTREAMLKHRSVTSAILLYRNSVSPLSRSRSLKVARSLGLRKTLNPEGACSAAAMQMCNSRFGKSA